jgi:hypothetical protein
VLEKGINNLLNEKITKVNLLKIGKLASIYSIIIGIAMLCMWTMFLLTGQVPELSTTPIQVSLHIVGEAATALALLVGGYGVWTNKKWGLQAYMLSMGMLLYTLIVSPGYYAQQGNMAMVGMFAAFFVIAIIFVCMSFIRKADYMPE